MVRDILTFQITWDTRFYPVLDFRKTKKKHFRGYKITFYQVWKTKVESWAFEPSAEVASCLRRSTAERTKLRILREDFEEHISIYVRNFCRSMSPTYYFCLLLCGMIGIQFLFCQFQSKRFSVLANTVLKPFQECITKLKI